MKLSDLFARLTFGKAKVLTTLGALAVAGAAMTVATPAAKAQVEFGVEVGRSGYYAPAPEPAYVAPEYGYGYGYNPHAYWEHRRAEEWREQQWRAQQWRAQQWRAQQWREQHWREHEYFEHHRDFDRDRQYDDRGWR